MKKVFLHRKISNRGLKVYLIILSATVLLNVLSWNSKTFSDWYMMNVLPLWVNSYGRFMSIFSFSVGEFMLIAGAVIVIVAVLLGLILGVVKISGTRRRMKIDTNLEDSKAYSKRVNTFSKKFNTFCKNYYIGTAWIALGVFILLTLNCFICYHGTDFATRYFPKEVQSQSDYTFDELVAVRDYVVEKCNYLSELMERDELGNIIYNGDMEAVAVECMQALGNDYEQLTGYYPEPKKICFSGFLSQQYMQGYFFPFSMEANYNRIMCIMNKPATMCHELAHLKGFLQEDEANLIGYLACIKSDDLFFQYSGYLSVLNYLDNDFYDAVNRDRDAYLSHVNVLPQVRKDNEFLTRETWDTVEKKALVSTETVDKISDEVVEVTLILNGVEDGMLSYSRVVGLLLDYYSKQWDEIYLVKQGN